MAREEEGGSGGEEGGEVGLGSGRGQRGGSVWGCEVGRQRAKREPRDS